MRYKMITSDIMKAILNQYKDKDITINYDDDLYIEETRR
jgi:hypothetical protein